MAILITRVQGPAENASVRTARRQAGVIEVKTPIFISKQSRAFWYYTNPPYS